MTVYTCLTMNEEYIVTNWDVDKTIVKNEHQNCDIFKSKSTYNNVFVLCLGNFQTH